MEEKKLKSSKGFGDFLCANRNLFIGLLIGCAAFLIIYGVRVLDVTYTGWTYGSGESGQHYLGWEFFRNAEWSFPPGMYNSLSYPGYASILYTDSIPLLAIFFKIIKFALPQDFQYLGWWCFISYMLQGGLSARLTEKYLKGTLQVAAASALFVLSPMLMLRAFMHTSLTSQWLILLALIFVVYYDERYKRLGRAFTSWCVLAAITVAVHPYFFLMCGMVLVGYLFKDFFKRKKPLITLLILAAYLAVGLLTMYLLGGFSSNNAEGSGLGEYSFNLNGLFNSRGFGVLPFLPSYSDKQQEGFAYAGLGVLFLAAVSLVTVIIYAVKERSLNKVTLKKSVNVYALLIICLISTVFAVSPIVTLGDKMLFYWPLPDFVKELWGMFRATGRTIWPMVLIFTLFAACAASRKLPKYLMLGLMVAAVGLQVWDFRGPSISKYGQFSGETVVYDSGLHSDIWGEIDEQQDIDHIMLKDYVLFSDQELYSFADIAREYDYKLNYFKFARYLGDHAYTDLTNALEQADEEALFVFRGEQAMTLSQYSYLHFYAADGNFIALAQPLSGIEELDVQNLATYVYDVGSAGWLNGGEVINGERNINKGGISFGPYITLPEGNTLVTLTGRNLSAANITIQNSYGGIKVLNTETVLRDDKNAVFRVVLEGDFSASTEVVVTNDSDQPVVLTGLTLTYEGTD